MWFPVAVTWFFELLYPITLLYWSCNIASEWLCAVARSLNAKFEIGRLFLFVVAGRRRRVEICSRRRAVNNRQRHGADMIGVLVVGWPPSEHGRTGTCDEARLRRMGGPQFDAVQRDRDGAGRGGSAAEPGAATAAQRCQEGGQTATKVGTDVVVDERVDAGIAVGQDVADKTEHGVPARVRLSADVDQQQVTVQRQPADAEHDHHRQEHPRRVRCSAPLASRSSGREADHRLATTGVQETQDEEIHRGYDGQRNDVGEQKKWQE